MAVVTPLDGVWDPSQRILVWLAAEQITASSETNAWRNNDFDIKDNPSRSTASVEFSDVVAGKRLVRGYEDQALELRLGDQRPVERVAIDRTGRYQVAATQGPARRVAQRSTVT